MDKDDSQHGELCSCDECVMLRRLSEHGRCGCYLCREIKIEYANKEDGEIIMMVTTII